MQVESPSADAFQARRVARLGIVGIVALACLAASVTLVLYRMTFGGPLVEENGVWGQFGDYMGGVLNPILGFLSLIAILFTVYMQAEELAAARAEAAQTRQLVAAQLETMRKQNFEATFFQLTTLHNQILESLKTRRSQMDRQEFHGRHGISAALGNLMGRLESAKTPLQQATMDQVFDEFWGIYQKDLGHYFRSLYNLVKLVDRSEIGDRQFYANLIRAQLSESEQKLLLLNCLSAKGRHKFKALVEQYGLLEGIDGAADLVHYSNMYAPRAFGR